jgi:hypothetical protein
MNPQPIRTIFDLAKFYGLSIELLDLPANNAGYLDPHDDPQYIAVNRNLPHCEQVFTIAHEICHYISDHKRPRRKYPNRLLNQQYKSRLAQLFVRDLRYTLNKILPAEREADMFAMSWLVQFGGGKDLKEFIDRHPEKTWLCMFISVNALVRMPFRIAKAIFGKLLFAQTKS